MVVRRQDGLSGDQERWPLVGYFQGDIGAINRPVHLWKFEDDADRLAHTDFTEGFAPKFRPW
jgi:hypothetical protein